MTYCTSCGSQANPTATVCSNCGAALPPAAGMEDAGRRFAFHGEGGSLFGIYLVAFLLSLVTLGIYSFWGRTNARRYMWSMLELEGDRFAYHGTGGELFKGFLKALLVLGGLYLLSSFLMYWGALEDAGAASVAGLLILVGGILLLVPIAQVGAWRYRMSRTSYRGVRFSFRGRASTLMSLYFKGTLLMIVTLGFYAPYFSNRLRRFFCQNAYYGDTPLAYDGEGRDLFGSYVLMLLLLIPTLTISAWWFQVKRFNYFWSRTTLAGARFHSEMTFGGLLGLAFTNMLLTLFTLGIGAPWAQVRGIRYVVERLSLRGAVDWTAIRQEAVAAGATGEELGGMLDGGGLDAGLGM